eukprot:TRINITY_DN22831_c0_g1_i1.p1 TRINITY_DN22831_c0_g1~~TRINITY_DN22831_c0_g1_i1.p1  ORF type:complete len:650 (-),score=88.88 TRINITY_DN22831_c0_g1_i1:497-2446(-)
MASLSAAERAAATSACTLANSLPSRCLSTPFSTATFPYCGSALKAAASSCSCTPARPNLYTFPSPAGSNVNSCFSPQQAIAQPRGGLSAISSLYHSFSALSELDRFTKQDVSLLGTSRSMLSWSQSFAEGHVATFETSKPSLSTGWQGDHDSISQFSSLVGRAQSMAHDRYLCSAEQPPCRPSQNSGRPRRGFRRAANLARLFSRDAKPGMTTEKEPSPFTSIASDMRNAPFAEEFYGMHPDKRVPTRWDVVGLGQAMIDFAGWVSDGFLVELGLEKGVRTVVDHEARGRVLRALDGNSYKVSAGGSLSNTLVALARLGMGDFDVAMTGSVGSDHLGAFYRNKLLRANVHFLSRPIPEGTTGTVVVLTTPDAQRTMLSYQGMSSVIHLDALLENAIGSTRLLVVEGYLWDIAETVDVIAKACAAARRKGVLVALTASDVSCVKRFRDNFWDVFSKSADVLFSNADEARALAGFPSSTCPAYTARHLSRFCPLVSVTDGAAGAYLAMKGESIFVPPSPCTPIDTCGAGDAYAAGILGALLVGAADLRSMGAVAARVAAVVVGQQGARLREEDAKVVAEEWLRRLGGPSGQSLALVGRLAMPRVGVSEGASTLGSSASSSSSSSASSGGSISSSSGSGMSSASSAAAVKEL